ncbi:MAG: phosphate signaling complex protein PhoU [Pseudomonadota bacterium]
MKPHTVRSYDDELIHLDRLIARMGGLTEAHLGQACDALFHRDPQLATRTMRADELVDALQREIEAQVINIIAKRQPVALDLRQIMAALRIANDLERIGDLAKNIAKRAYAVSGEIHPQPVISGLRNMLEMTLAQLKDVLDAYAQRDTAKALKVWHDDENIDAMYNSLFREMLTYMMEDPRNISVCTHLLFGAKNLERIGDHTTNVAENVNYVVTGEMLDDDRPKVDDTSTTMLSPDD